MYRHVPRTTPSWIDLLFVRRVLLTLRSVGFGYLQHLDGPNFSRQSGEFSVQHTARIVDQQRTRPTSSSPLWQQRLQLSSVKIPLAGKRETVWLRRQRQWTLSKRASTSSPPLPLHIVKVTQTRKHQHHRLPRRRFELHCTKHQQRRSHATVRSTTQSNRHRSRTANLHACSTNPSTAYTTLSIDFRHTPQLPEIVSFCPFIST
ncbi:hypothetical protein PHSY_000683 [Pseudozyma hubeiensis SY62]|uniref:Uncharacterized protein n=1 Tax=Pseudozyma hubeiensis (strain SY62) TaxID=1305764 RepID=R9NX40_PSEHS|nr:hypothetical protein PHSY_000683 [Pseudozyma hubeiensis SY62]GAC93121.1 hypothetical protein PHSY_000683 [Pseudozyma hubeiensis SY62]